MTLIDVEVRLKETSQAKEFTEVENTYEKGSFYCLYLGNEKVRKIPIQDIFDVTEDYGEHP